MDAWACASVSESSLSHPPLQLEDMKTQKHLWLQSVCSRRANILLQDLTMVMPTKWERNEKERAENTNPCTSSQLKLGASAPDHPKGKCNVKHKSGKLITRMAGIQMALCLPQQCIKQLMLKKTILWAEFWTQEPR